MQKAVVPTNNARVDKFVRLANVVHVVIQEIVLMANFVRTELVLPDVETIWIVQAIGPV